MWTLFEYQYRDAGNFKSRGAVALAGAIEPSQWESALRSLEDGLFVAEQIGLPPLYEQLYVWSDGPCATDHCWHEFVAVTVVHEDALPPDVPHMGTATAFIERLAAIQDWDGALSPHFAL